MDRGDWFHWDDGDLLIRLRVQPRASNEGFTRVIGEAIGLRVMAAPVDNQANASLVRYLARQFGVSKQRVLIIKGERSRTKLVRIQAPVKLPGIAGLVPEENRDGAG